jgi:hypothetical protein
MTETERCPHCGWTPAEQDAQANELRRLRELVNNLRLLLPQPSFCHDLAARRILLRMVNGEEVYNGDQSS